MPLKKNPNRKSRNKHKKEDYQIKTFRVRLKTSKKIHRLLMQYSGAARYAYNWALTRSDEYYELTGKTINEGDLRKEFTAFKNKDGNEWTYDVYNDSFKQGIKDFCKARSNFFEGLADKPTLKKKFKSECSYYNDTIDLIIESGKVRLGKIGWVQLCEKNRLPLKSKFDKHFFNPRVKFDGNYWYLTVSIHVKETPVKLNKDLSIGIDLGLKTFATIVYDRKDKVTYKSIPSKKEEFKKLEKKKKRIQRKISKHFESNKKIVKEMIKQDKKKNPNDYKNEEERRKELCLKKNQLFNPNNLYVELSNNQRKRLAKLNKICKRETNIQKEIIYQLVVKLAKTKPNRIVIEDLNVAGMMKNKHLSKWIKFQQFYFFRRHLTNKCNFFHIPLVLADRFFPSTKLCSKCGKVKDRMLLDERIYICECGLKKDRDINAGINLARYKAS